MKKYLLAGVALALASAPALAGTPFVDKREKRQAHRIYNGIKNGNLTFGETAKLLKGQLYVRRLERQFKADGVVTPLERARLHWELTKQSVRIYNKKHN